MKFFYVILFLLPLMAQGQRFNNKKSQTMKIRHVMGQKSVDLSVGLSGYGGALGSIYYSQFIKNNLYWKAGGGYEFKNSTGDIRYTSAFMDGLGGLTITDKGSLFLNVIGGITLAMDNVSGIDTSKKKSGFIYGGVIGLEGEFYLVNNIIFVISGTQRIIIPKEFDDRWYISAGLKFKL